MGDTRLTVAASELKRYSEDGDVPDDIAVAARGVYGHVKWLQSLHTAYEEAEDG